MPSWPDGASSRDEAQIDEHVREHGARLRVVVDDQDAAATQIRLQDAPARRHLGLAEARREPERAALAGLARHPDLAAHQLRQPLGDGKAEPGAAIFARGRGVGLLEGLEQPPDLLLGEADAGVADREAE